MFSIMQVKDDQKRQEIFTKEWTDCKNFTSEHACFGMYNGDKEPIGFAAVRQKDLTASIFCFSFEPFSNQAVLRDFFFKGILGILSQQGVFFLQAEEKASDLMQEFQFAPNATIEDLLKGSCSHDS